MSSSTASFGVVDYVVFGASLVISFVVGVYFAFKGSNNNEVTLENIRLYSTCLSKLTNRCYAGVLNDFCC